MPACDMTGKVSAECNAIIAGTIFGTFILRIHNTETHREQGPSPRLVLAW